MNRDCDVCLGVDGVVPVGWRCGAHSGESFPTENALSGENGGGGNRTRATFPRKAPDFQALVQIGGIELSVEREGKHTNVHVCEPTDDGEAGHWTFEPLETALPKLEALVDAARLIQEIP